MSEPTAGSSPQEDNPSLKPFKQTEEEHSTQTTTHVLPPTGNDAGGNSYCDDNLDGADKAYGFSKEAEAVAAQQGGEDKAQERKSVQTITIAEATGALDPSLSNDNKEDSSSPQAGEEATIATSTNGKPSKRSGQGAKNKLNPSAPTFVFAANANPNPTKKSVPINPLLAAGVGKTFQPSNRPPQQNAGQGFNRSIANPPLSGGTPLGFPQLRTNNLKNAGNKKAPGPRGNPAQPQSQGGQGQTSDSTKDLTESGGEGWSAADSGATTTQTGPKTLVSGKSYSNAAGVPSEPRGYVPPAPAKRDKLSEQELEEKMAKMRLVNAETLARSEAQERDAQRYAEQAAAADKIAREQEAQRKKQQEEDRDRRLKEQAQINKEREEARKRKVEGLKTQGGANREDDGGWGSKRIDDEAGGDSGGGGGRGGWGGNRNESSGRGGYQSRPEFDGGSPKRGSFRGGRGGGRTGSPYQQPRQQTEEPPKKQQEQPHSVNQPTATVAVKAEEPKDDGWGTSVSAAAPSSSSTWVEQSNDNNQVEDDDGWGSAPTQTFAQQSSKNSPYYRDILSGKPRRFIAKDKAVIPDDSHIWARNPEDDDKGIVIPFGPEGDDSDDGIVEAKPSAPYAPGRRVLARQARQTGNRSAQSSEVDEWHIHSNKKGPKKQYTAQGNFGSDVSSRGPVNYGKQGSGNGYGSRGGYGGSNAQYASDASCNARGGGYAKQHSMSEYNDTWGGVSNQENTSSGWNDPQDQGIYNKDAVNDFSASQAANSSGWDNIETPQTDPVTHPSIHQTQTQRWDTSEVRAAVAPTEIRRSSSYYASEDSSFKAQRDSGWEGFRRKGGVATTPSLSRIDDVVASPVVAAQDPPAPSGWDTETPAETSKELAINAENGWNAVADDGWARSGPADTANKPSVKRVRSRSIDVAEPLSSGNEGDTDGEVSTAQSKDFSGSEVSQGHRTPIQSTFSKTPWNMPESVEELRLQDNPGNLLGLRRVPNLFDASKRQDGAESKAQAEMLSSLIHLDEEALTPHASPDAQLRRIRSSSSATLLDLDVDGDFNSQPPLIPKVGQPIASPTSSKVLLSQIVGMFEGAPFEPDFN